MSHRVSSRRKKYKIIFDFLKKMSEFSSTDHCHYIVPRKKRRCRMFTKVGKRFCGEHSHLLEENQGTFS